MGRIKLWYSSDDIKNGLILCVTIKMSGSGIKLGICFIKYHKMKFVFCLNALAVLALPTRKLPDKLQKYQNSTGISDAEIWNIYESSINGDLIWI